MCVSIWLPCVQLPKIRYSSVAPPFGSMCGMYAVCVCSSASAADDEREEKKLLASSGTDARTSLQVLQGDVELGQGRRGETKTETETEAQLRELLKTEREQKVVFAYLRPRLSHVVGVFSIFPLYDK